MKLRKSDRILLLLVIFIHLNLFAQDPNIFELVKEIQLSSEPDHSIGGIDDFCVDSNGKFLIDDAYKSKCVFVFNSDGSFFKKLGGRGQGPGEFNEPASIDVSLNGDIYVCDGGNARIAIFDKKYEYSRQIFQKNRNHRNIHINSRNEVYVYNGMRPIMGDKLHDTIIKLDRQGDIVESFAPLQKEILSMNMCSARDGIVLDNNNNIYELNPIFYEIRKYNSDEKLLDIFHRKSRLYKIITDEEKIPILINGPYIIKNKYLLVQLSDHVEILTTEGDLYKGEIPFKEQIIGSDADKFYTMIWPFETDIKDDRNPIIKVYKIIYL